jgi:hypothetical protein
MGYHPVWKSGSVISSMAKAQALAWLWAYRTIVEHEQMGAAIVAAVAGLLGVALGYLGQYLRARQEHKWAIETVKREAYAEFLRSISASYAQAESEAEFQQSHRSGTKSSQTDKPQQSHKSEDADLRAATASIVLLAKREIHEKASDLTEQIIKVHNRLRGGDSAAQDDVSGVNSNRLALIELFKDDLGIPPGEQPQHESHVKLLVRRMRPAKSTGAAER